jgi:GNAT superfamily N-acetyltransferase
MIRLQRVIHALPADFETLQSEARGEGFRMLDRLARDWASGETRFDRDGEALLVAYSNDVLAGVGGLTVEPAIAGAFRMRRFYVRAAFRRTGVARRLAAALLGQCSAACVTINTAGGSEPFWEALGFAPDERDGRTHILTGRRARG